jgi:hypothetical protein
MEAIKEIKLKQIQADSDNKICPSCYLIDCCCEADKQQASEDDYNEMYRNFCREQDKPKVKRVVKQRDRNCSRCGEYDADIKKKAKPNNMILFCKKCIDRTNKRFDEEDEDPEPDEDCIAYITRNMTAEEKDEYKKKLLNILANGFTST